MINLLETAMGLVKGHYGSHERAEQLQEYFDRWVRVTTGLIYGEQA